MKFSLPILSINFLNFVEDFHDKIDKSDYRIMVQTFRYNDEIFHSNFAVIVPVVVRKWLHCCLVIIPVNSLYSILNDKNIVLRKITDYDVLYFLSTLSFYSSYHSAFLQYL